MALTSGAGPHSAWLNVNGSPLPITHGNVSQSAQRKSSQFSVTIPLSFSGAKDILANVGGRDKTSIGVTTRGVTGNLIVGYIENVNFDYIGRTIHVDGHDVSALLHEKKISESFRNKKGSEIVSDLIGRCDLTGSITSSDLMAGKKIYQDYVKLTDNVSFAYVIHKISEQDGARWFVDNNGTFSYFNVPGTAMPRSTSNSPARFRNSSNRARCAPATACRPSAAWRSSAT